MPRYKYPAPFDPPDPGPIEVKGAPQPPQPPTYPVPLPVDIPVGKSKPVNRSSLYKDLFGSDLSVVADAYDANWASSEQRDLARQLLSGQKSVHSLSTPELELLDDLAIRFNNQGGEKHEDVRPVHRERLSVPDDDAVGGKDDQEVQSGGESDLQSDTPSNIAGAYGWLSGGEEGSGK